MFKQELAPYQFGALATLAATIEILRKGIARYGSVPAVISEKFRQPADLMLKRFDLLQAANPDLYERLSEMRNTVLATENGCRLLAD